MRVTSKMLTNDYKSNLNSTMSSLQKVQKQLYTGKIVSKPSDDPFIATRVMDYTNQIARKEQYERNIEDSITYADMTDTALGQVTEQMKRLKELSIQASQDTNSDADLGVIATEMDEIMNSIVDSLNTSIEGKYIFGGTETDKPPFVLDNGKVKFQGNNEIMQVEIATGIKVNRNISSDSVLGGVEMDGEMYNLFDSINALSEAVREGDKDQVRNLMSHIDSHTDNIIDVRAKVGGSQQRLDLALSKTQEEILGVTTMLSKTQDVDYAEKFIDYKVLEASYTATLQISSSIIKPSLLDFLR